MHILSHEETPAGVVKAIAEQETYRSPLDDSDLAWLTPFRNKDTGPDDLISANHLIGLGSLDLRKVTDPLLKKSVIGARHKFFGNWLGWENEDHPMNGAYRNFEGHHTRLGPPLTFVATQRIFQEYGVDGYHATRLNPSILWKGSGNIRTSLDNMIAQGFNAGKLVREQPNLINLRTRKLNNRVARLTKDGVSVDSIEGHALAKPNYYELCLRHYRENGDKAAYRAEQRIRSLSRVVLALEWGLETEDSEGRPLPRSELAIRAQAIAKDIFEKQRNMRKTSDSRLMVQARLITHLGISDLWPEEAGRLVGIPIETQIIALMRDVPYLPLALERLNKSLGRSKRQIVADLIANQRPELEAKIGPKTVLAYERYASRPVAQR